MERFGDRRLSQLGIQEAYLDITQDLGVVERAGGGGRVYILTGIFLSNCTNFAFGQYNLMMSICFVTESHGSG